MDIKADEISKIIRDQIGSYAVDVDVAEVGTVVTIGDGIARVHGIERTMAGEMIEFPHGVYGIALNLEEDSVGTVLLGDYLEIKEGDPVKRTGRIISVPVGEELLGRVVMATVRPVRAASARSIACAAPARSGTALVTSARTIPCRSISRRRYSSSMSGRSTRRSRPASRWSSLPSTG